MINPSIPNNNYQEIGRKADLTNKKIIIKKQVSPPNESEINLNNQIEDRTKKMLETLSTYKPTSRLVEAKKYDLDTKFICSEMMFKNLYPQIEDQLEVCITFDTAAFLRGTKNNSPGILMKIKGFLIILRYI